MHPVARPARGAAAPARRPSRTEPYRAVPAMADEKKLVLITGAAGTYGRILRTEWGDRYNVCTHTSASWRVQPVYSLNCATRQHESL